LWIPLGSGGMRGQFSPPARRSCRWLVAASPSLREILPGVRGWWFFFSSRRRHTRSVSAFLLNRSSDLMFLTLMRPSLVLFLVLWLKLVKDFLKVRCRLALLPFLISCLIWLDLVASLPLIKERILVIILLLHFLS